MIEVMIVVAIIGILAAIAYPSYRDYIIRSHLVDATNGLSSMRAEMERYFQDNRRYDSVAPFVSPCLRVAAQRTFGDFVVSCTTGPTQLAYVMTADGSGVTANFHFTVDQTDTRSTTTTEPGWTAATPNTCWIVRKGQAC